MTQNRKPIFKMLPLICGVFFVLTAQVISAQEEQEEVAPRAYGHWLTYSGDHRINDRIGIMSLGSFRNYFIDRTQEQVVVRVGLNYYFNPRTILTAGYGFMYSEPSEDDVAVASLRENQIWQQFIMRHRTRTIFWEHRYRLEQRFMSNLSTGDSFLDHRVRYRFQVIVPFYTLSPHLRHFFFAANDEFFANLGRSTSAEIFDRNRLFFGLGFQISPKFNVQMGYLNQYIGAPPSEHAIVQHTLQVSVSYNMEDIMRTFFNRPQE
jgi:hypothetical protein